MREVQNTGVPGYTCNRELYRAVDPALGSFAVDACLIPYPSFSSARLNLSCNSNLSESTVEREFPSPRSTAICTLKLGERAQSSRGVNNEDLY